MQQKLYSDLLVNLRKKYPDSVYDGALPPDGTPYPFIYLGTVTETGRQTKHRGIPKDASVMIHVYHNNVRHRGELSGIVDAIEDVCYNLDTFGCVGYSTTILPDNTTSEPLIHAAITADFIN